MQQRLKVGLWIHLHLRARLIALLVARPRRRRCAALGLNRRYAATTRVRPRARLPVPAPLRPVATRLSLPRAGRPVSCRGQLGLGMVVVPQVAEGDTRIQVLLPVPKRLLQLLLAGLLSSPHAPIGWRSTAGQPRRGRRAAVEPTRTSHWTALVRRLT